MISILFSALVLLPQPLADWRVKVSKSQEISATFTQEVVQDLFPDSGDRATGSLRARRPALMVWTYESPQKQVLTVNGKEITTERGGSKTTTSHQGPLTLEQAFGFLWGTPDASLFKTEELKGGRVRILPLVETTFDSIEVSFKKGWVHQIDVKDKLGGQSRLIFSDWHLKD
jgi:outer membrane lipoprotein-sorting protein